MGVGVGVTVGVDVAGGVTVGIGVNVAVGRIPVDMGGTVTILNGWRVGRAVAVDVAVDVGV